MNGFDFNFRVLQPWARDPAFYQQIGSYQSDVPAQNYADLGESANDECLVPADCGPNELCKFDVGQAHFVCENISCE